ncbi:hypothetical protein RUM44_002877 [Polyplax serrata]|uniref:DUF4485 domain-containing protein n=1 Tax=Polyplax serrata TaxID=468196 RepID=A0ABR1AYP8_POLSC
MGDDSKSFDRKLDRDFLTYLTLTKGLFDKIEDEKTKQLCQVWLTHLVSNKFCSLREKCNRNIYLSRLLLQMQSKVLQGIFQGTPPAGPLPCAFSTFDLPVDVDGIKGYEETGFQIDSTIGGSSGDFSEASRDGRMFLATKRIPQGMMAYMAVTNNDGEELWRPQVCPSPPQPLDASAKPQKEVSEFVKKLGYFVKSPLCGMRKSPEERTKVIDWMDKIIEDCNKWISGQDPHNTDLESLFEMMYNDYKCDPEKEEIFKHPKKLRTVLIKDIRDQMAERRAEVSKRELILDQYESDQYVEERMPGQQLDEVWLQCAKKPLSEQTRAALEVMYPPEVINRFFEYLFQERIYIIEKGENETKKRIAELRSGSVDDLKKELLKLKKIQMDYKEYYAAYKDIEIKEAEYAKEWKEKCSKSERADQEQKCSDARKEIECEIEQLKKNLDKERRCMKELTRQLAAEQEHCETMESRMNAEGEKLNCQMNEVQKQKKIICVDIQKLKKKRDELTCKLMEQENSCSC